MYTSMILTIRFFLSTQDDWVTNDNAPIEGATAMSSHLVNVRKIAPVQSENIPKCVCWLGRVAIKRSIRANITDRQTDIHNYRAHNV